MRAEIRAPGVVPMCVPGDASGAGPAVTVGCISCLLYDTEFCDGTFVLAV
ncbi:hypothetical protein PTKU64_91070 (plasmid) [Paraburkholderia terrae]|uniref:Uncharacterized protein n=1 Tax=Paraburkholderia terrae TaxID=311230 RepID=A0ABM7U2C6_9BURK|nr:hypothetical protein [Paraburkholderia terrae]BCZ85432.1 hypothetical protein PTKU64_91070 [Paraburkholderia terrae]